jgi:hypothetical protein
MIASMQIKVKGEYIYHGAPVPGNLTFNLFEGEANEGVCFVDFPNTNQLNWTKRDLIRFRDEIDMMINAMEGDE